MPIDLEALNKQIGGVLPGPKTERSNVYIPTKEEQNKSGYNTHYSFEDTTEDLKNKIASQQGFGDWISKVPLTFGAAVASGAAATGGVVIEASKMAGAALWTPLENFDSYMSGSNKWHSFASNYEAGNPLIDFAEGIKQMTKDWQLNYADNRTFMGKIEAFTESAINSLGESLGEYVAIGGLTSFGAAASLAKLGIKGMAKNYTVGAIASYVGGAREGIVNAREEFDYNYQNANEMLNKKYDKKLQDLATLKENEGLDEEAYNIKLQEIDKSYKEEQEYIHDVLNQSALSTIAFNTAAIGTMNLLEFNLFGNSYNLLEAGIRKLKGKSKLYDNILSPALGKNIDEISYNDLLSIEANKVKASNWTSMKSWGMGSLAEGSEETISDSIKILSEGYAQDKLNEKKLAKNYNGQNFMDKWLSYMSSPEMIETFIGGAYAGGLTQGGMRVIGKMMGKDTQEQEELMTYTRELLETQKPIKETLEKITQKGAAIDQAVKYLDNKEYDKYNAAISQIFNSNIINSIEKGTFNVNKAVLQNQIKENNDKISKLESEKLADTTPDLVSKKQEEIKNLKLYNENVKTGVKILENYEKTYNHYKEVYGNNKIAEIVIGKDVEIEFARNYLKQMDLTRTVEDSDSFRIRDLALKLNGKVMGDRVAKAITINDYYKAISETYKSIVNDFKLLGDDATEDDMLEMKKEIEELKEFSEIATTSFIQKEIFENSIKDNIAFKNKIDRDVDFRLKLTEESMSKELRKEIESELEDTYYAKRRNQLIEDLIGKLKKEGLSQEEVIEIEKSLKKEWVDDTLIDNYNQQQIDNQTVNQSKIEDTIEDDEEEIEENINNEIVSEADIEIGKVGNTEYEVKVDGVYYQGKKLNNPENKTHRQLIEADIKTRRQEELDNLFSQTQASTDKQLNTPVQKLSKEEINRNIETAKQQNKDLIEELENPEFLNDEKRNDEWDKKADELSDKLPQGVSFRITDGKVDFFDRQSYREKGFGKYIVTVSVFTLHKQTEKFEVGDNLQVQDGSRAMPAIVTKVNEHGKILEAKQEDGRIIISRGNIITLAPINDRLKINAKYDAELKALEQQPKSNQSEIDKKADIERRRQEELKQPIKDKLQEIEKAVKTLNITTDKDGKLEQTSDEIITNIKSELDKIGLPYKGVASNENGSSYKVITNDGTEIEVVKLLKSGGALIKPTLSTAKFINHLIKTEPQTLRDLISNQINAKYDAELKALEQQPKSNQSEIDKKAYIERRRQEVDRISKLPFQERVQALQDVGIIDSSISTQMGVRFPIIVNINGVKVPFYRSSDGTQGKIKGNWYPFFGFGKSSSGDSWLIKGDTKNGDVNSHYGSVPLQKYAEILNSVLNWNTDIDKVRGIKNHPFMNMLEQVSLEEFNEKVYNTKDLNIINGTSGETNPLIYVDNRIKEINAKYDAELALLKGKTATKTKRTQAEKTSTNESINEQESIQIREELLDKLFKKDFVHLFQFKSNKQSDIQEISEKIKSLFEVLKEFFDANENLLTTDKKAIINEVNFNVFYEFAKQFESIKSKFPFIQEFENKANDESLSEEDLDALIEENRLLYDSYLELMSDLSAVKEKLSSKATKKEIKDFLTIPEDDGSDFIDDYAIKVLNFIDVITTLKEDKSNEEEVVKLIESNNEDYDSTIIYASLDPIKKNSLEKIIDDEYTTLTKLDVNNTLTSSTLEYDEASETVNGAKKKNGVVPETTKKILSGEYNGKNFVLRLESNLEIEEQPINEIDKLNEHELEKLKLMVDRLKRIYSGIEFQFATVNELRDQLPDDQKKFADKYRAVYIKNEGKIVFNINNKNLSYETAIHEIAHPLIVLIQQQNVKLYSELLDISKTLDKDNTTIQNFVLKNYFESRLEQQLTDKERLNYEHECIAHALEISGSKSITYQERLDKKTNNKKLLIIQKFRRKFEEIIKYLIKAVMKKFFKTSSILKDEKGNPAIFKGLMTNKQIEIKMSDINYDMSLDMLSDLMLSLKVKIDLSSVSENSSKEDIILGSMKEEINKIQRNKQKGC